MERSSPSPREIISESESTSLLVSQAVTEIQRAGTESETSGRGRRKRAPRQFGDLNSCLCGTAVNLSVDSNGAIECRQLGCETRWVSSTVLPNLIINLTHMFYSITFSV